MVVSLNKIQTKQFAEFLSSMAVAWLIAALINPPTLISIFQYFGYGIISLYLSMHILRRIK